VSSTSESKGGICPPNRTLTGLVAGPFETESRVLRELRVSSWHSRPRGQCRGSPRRNPRAAPLAIIGDASPGMVRRWSCSRRGAAGGPPPPMPRIQRAPEVASGSSSSSEDRIAAGVVSHELSLRALYRVEPRPREKAAYEHDPNAVADSRPWLSSASLNGLPVRIPLEAVLHRRQRSRCRHGGQLQSSTNQTGPCLDRELCASVLCRGDGTAWIPC
jgi:hypothetical protein